MHVLQELGGWECADRARGYAHLSGEQHLAECAGRMSGPSLVGEGSVEMATLRLRSAQLEGG